MADGDWANAIAEDEGKLSNQVDLNLYLKRLFFLKLHSTHKKETKHFAVPIFQNGNYLEIRSVKFEILCLEGLI